MSLQLEFDEFEARRARVLDAARFARVLPDEVAVIGGHPAICIARNDFHQQSQPHLLAISGRDELKEAVTDVLVERRNREVVHKLAVNSSVRFSENGYGVLVKRAEDDDILAEKVGMRLDIPIRLLRELLLRAREAVRSKLLSLAPPHG